MGRRGPPRLGLLARCADGSHAARRRARPAARAGLERRVGRAGSTRRRQVPTTSARSSSSRVRTRSSRRRARESSSATSATQGSRRPARETFSPESWPRSSSKGMDGRLGAAAAAAAGGRGGPARGRAPRKRRDDRERRGRGSLADPLPLTSPSDEPVRDHDRPRRAAPERGRARETPPAAPSSGRSSRPTPTATAPSTAPAPRSRAGRGRALRRDGEGGRGASRRARRCPHPRPEPARRGGGAYRARRRGSRSRVSSPRLPEGLACPRQGGHRHGPVGDVARGGRADRPRPRGRGHEPPRHRRRRRCGASSRAQLDAFAAVAERFPGATRHVANSAATLSIPEARFDAVRCGVALYGLSPFGRDPEEHGLEPVLSWRSYVAQAKVAATRRQHRLRTPLRRRAGDSHRPRPGGLRGRLPPRADRHRGACGRLAPARPRDGLDGLLRGRARRRSRRARP